jgi:predicted nucleic acid-binding protein
MAIILLDSCVIFDHLNGRNRRTESLSKPIEQGHILACCSVNITEVFAGLRAGEERITESFLDSLEYLPVSAKIARQAGMLRQEWRAKGQTLSFSDVKIAAVALSNAAPLLTDNLKHFPMEELVIYPMPEDRSDSIPPRG